MIYEFEDLVKKLESSDSNDRQEACYYLAKLETKESANLLAQALADPDLRVRNLAKKSLERLKLLGIEPDSNFIPKFIKFSLQSYSQNVQNNLSNKSKEEAKLLSNNKNQVDSSLTRKNIDIKSDKPQTSQNLISSIEKQKLQDNLESTLSNKNITNLSCKEKTNFDNELKKESNNALDDWYIALDKSSETAFYEVISKLEAKEKINILSKIESMPRNKRWAYKLKYALQNEQDPFVTSKLVKVFGYHYGEGVIRYISDFLEHEDERVVANTLESLALAGGKAEIELIMHYIDHPTPRIRSTAANCLWQSNPNIAFEVVKQMARSTLLWEREAAKFALKNCPLPEAKSLLNQIESSLPKLSNAAKKQNNANTLGKTPNKEYLTENISNQIIFSNYPTITKIINFPVAVGLDNPMPLWLFLCILIFAILFFFYIALPLVDLIMPLPSPEI